MKGVGKALAMVSAMVLCPCHWPLWLGVLAGTGFGALLAPYATPLLIVAGGGFALAVAYLLRGMVRRPLEAGPTDPPCASCGGNDRETHSIQGGEDLNCKVFGTSVEKLFNRLERG